MLASTADFPPPIKNPCPDLGIIKMAIAKILSATVMKLFFIMMRTICKVGKWEEI